MPHDRSLLYFSLPLVFLFRLSLPPFFFYLFSTLRFTFTPASPPSRAIPTVISAPVSLREGGYSFVGGKNTGDPNWRAIETNVQTTSVTQCNLSFSLLLFSSTFLSPPSLPPLGNSASLLQEHLKVFFCSRKLSNVSFPRFSLCLFGPVSLALIRKIALIYTHAHESLLCIYIYIYIYISIYICRVSLVLSPVFSFYIYTYMFVCVFSYIFVSLARFLSLSFFFSRFD